ncbi:hypothetical protein [Phenylobacterium sp.]|uniref:hypothetical protein n=1 Tax=Phenylobacterium sp. TaxID=1871053 RepID=UPI002DF1FBA6|nr:hypothetical protein [Phenylobacterium sp.]
MIRFACAAAILLGGAGNALAEPAAPAAQPMPDMPAMSHAAPAAAAAPVAAMPGMDMPMHKMTGALGGYPMTREASGTAWQPDASEHEGLHIMRGDWMVMLHATVNGVYDWQQGPRGDTKGFASGMLMGMAKRTFASGDMVQFKAMLSPDPFMGPGGYPLLLATGETADGKTPLIDRQHPHDLFMELSTSYTHKLTDSDSVFLYAGLPGEPAFGPPAFMHRQSIMDSPEAPISHHWLDSTHITMGVLTAGYVHDNWKAEVSRYRGREPDQHRFDIEAPKLDSTALRLSWNPTRNLSLQASWADEKSPEQLEPALNQEKWSASAIYTTPFGADGWWSTTAAWGQRTSSHGTLPAWVLESAIKPAAPWTVFARAERVDNDELVAGGPLAGRVFTVGKVSIGAIHDWPVADHLSFGLGALYAWNFVPEALGPLFGGTDPHGAMGFVRFKLR